MYRAIALQRLPNAVDYQQIGELEYLMAATPLQAGTRQAILTVPLASRQREIEREIDELDRGVQLGALVLIVLGAGIGYWMAERIGDPVQRLTRATRRIAAGDLSARVIVKTADELQRLVEAFNKMAGELGRQRQQLERTHRLEAWAEMARQVAHDIKNPLTPIQLSAEHLRRVNQDRGQPLSPVLDNCVDTILTQVRLLRQIASEFSSFGTSPTVTPAPTAMRALVDEVIDPYRLGTAGRITFDLEVPDDLPVLTIDRMLMGRAITNIVENALYAMPSGGVLSLRAREVRANGDSAERRERPARRGTAHRRHRLRHGRRSGATHFRAVFFHESDRHGPRLEHRPPQRGTARRHDHRRESEGRRHHRDADRAGGTHAGTQPASPASSILLPQIARDQTVAMICAEDDSGHTRCDCESPCPRGTHQRC